MVEKIKLDVKDRKLLALLDENSRDTNSQIARAIGLSKPAVEYRIKRLIENKVIFEFYTVIDFSRLGYSLYKVYFKFQNTSLQEENKITNYWINSKNSIWVAQIRGLGDLAVTILAKSNFEFGQILGKFTNLYSKYILEKQVLLNETTSLYSKENKKEIIYETPSKEIELDKTDKRILKELAINARINIVDLAENINLSRDIVNYRIKKLTKDKVISQYKCYPNLQNIGINHYKLIIRTKNFNEQEESKLKQYLSKHKKATQFLKLIGSWDLEIEFEAESEDDLYNTLNEFRKDFSEVIRDFDIIRITKTFKYNYFPF